MRFLSYIFLPFLFLSYLITDTYLKLNHSALCHSKGCELAATLIKIDAVTLNYIGIASALLLLFLGVLAYKELVSKKVFLIYLLSCVLFETIMLGYQFFASPVLCKFCLGVYGFLLLTMLFTSWKYFVAIIPLIIAPFIALSLLSIPRHISFIDSDANYLIQSPTCPHCKLVKDYLHQKKIPFIKLNSSDIEDRNFIRFLGYKTIPLLIIKKGSHTTIVNGDEDIVEYFEKQKQKQKQAEKMDLQTQSKEAGLLELSPKKGDGCEIDLALKPSCKKEKK